MNDAYPVQFSVDYPDRDLNRVSTGFRIFTVIPIAIVIGTHRWLQRAVGNEHHGHERGRPWRHGAAVHPAAADDLVPSEVPAVVV